MGPPNITTVSPPTAGAQRAAGFYHPELDGLRFCCFLSVFFSHAVLYQKNTLALHGPYFAELGRWLGAAVHSGYAAVAVFFVLSSYLITELLLREFERTNKIDVGAFYLRRTLRIWPLYFAFLLVVLAIERPGLPNSEWYFVFLVNWQFIWENAIPDSSAQILWSVSVEEQFYLVWPLLIACFTPKRLGVLCLLLLAVGNLSRLMLLAQGAPHFAYHFSTWTQCDAVAWGALLALAARRGVLEKVSLTARRGLVVSGVLIILASWRFLSDPRPFPGWQVLAYPLYAAAAGAIVAGAYRTASERPGLLANPLLVHLGKISYGLYVWHLLAIGLVFAFGWAPERGVRSVCLALLLTLVLAEISYFCLEKPFLRLKARYQRAETPAPSGPPAAAAPAM